MSWVGTHPVEYPFMTNVEEVGASELESEHTQRNPQILPEDLFKNLTGNRASTSTENTTRNSRARQECFSEAPDDVVVVDWEGPDDPAHPRK